MIPPFERFFEAHRHAVYGYLRFRLYSAADAADCFQETFLAALKGYPELRNGDNLKAWVLTIAERKATDLLRSHAKSPTPLPRLPEQDAREQPGDGALWSAVARLPDKQRAAVAHRFLGDLAYGDMGRVMGISEEAARQNVRQGLKKLRGVIDR